MRGHSPAPKGLLTCSPGGSQRGELSSLLMCPGRKACAGATWSCTPWPLFSAGRLPGVLGTEAEYETPEVRPIPIGKFIVW